QVFEHVLEPADGCTTGNTSSSYGRPGERRDPAAAIGRAIEIRIMVDHRNAVTRAVHVGLDIAVSFFGGSPERGQGVFHPCEVVHVPAAMCEGTWEGAGQVRVRAV